MNETTRALHALNKYVAFAGLCLSLTGLILAANLTNNLYILNDDGYIIWAVAGLSTVEFLFFVYTLFPAETAKTRRIPKILVFLGSLLVSVSAFALSVIVVEAYQIHAVFIVPFLLALLAALTVTVLSCLYALRVNRKKKK